MTAINITGQAEVKLLKVGEPLASNVDGNPEPSRSEDQACVETRRGVCNSSSSRRCLKCEGPIPSTKYKNAKYCSERCRSAYITYQWCLKNKRFEKPGSGSGGNQEGEKNHQYKTGIGLYSKKAFEHYGRQCNRCQSTKHLLVHHKDENRANNELENLEVLCKRCHQEHHCIRDLFGRYTKG